MRTIEAQGFTKAAAYETTGLDVEFALLKNATQKWKKEGSPMNTKELNKFMTEYMTANKAVGAYIVVDGSSKDTRLRPYSVINVVTDGKRKSKRVYQIKEATFKTKTSTVVNEEGVEETIKVVDPKSVVLGVVVGREGKKSEAVAAAKKLTTANKRAYGIEIVEEIVEGQKYAAFVDYTPSESAKLGKFIFFNKEV